ncbi:NAD(P)/FAD-dependent oxidoreductase [Bauldia sp.]|uniref:NAD(P)/FAD-dependent oxidoreductase n=1 Tax=Bauldia sp. TaxID=2575872 RepID=UPI003BAD57CD
MRVLVCGAGVIGAAVAYFLTRRGITVSLIERTDVACAASGKSGGFLALDWCDGSPLEPLARRSFVLHAELAESLGVDYGYRRMTTYSGHADAREPTLASDDLDVGWLSDRVSLDRRLGTTETTAQIDPARFTRAMVDAAMEAGAELVTGTVTNVMRTDDGTRAIGVTVDGKPVTGDAVVVAMGPWSILASAWMRMPPVFGLKGHSVIYGAESSLPADALFIDMREASGAVSSPEVFPRPDGTTYICGVSSEVGLPVDPGAVEPDPEAIERLEAMASAMSPALTNAPVLARQACFRPLTRDGLPLIGVVPGLESAYVATGHSVWGMLNAPATGEALAELIVDGIARTVDLSAFDPGRMPPFDPTRLDLQAH